MITNQKELLIAAQTAAADSLKIKSPVELHDFKSDKFKALGIGHEHFNNFAQRFDASRNDYENLEKQEITAPK